MVLSKNPIFFVRTRSRTLSRFSVSATNATYSRPLPRTIEARSSREPAVARTASFPSVYLSADNFQSGSFVFFWRAILLQLRLLGAEAFLAGLGASSIAADERCYPIFFGIAFTLETSHTH